MASVTFPAELGGSGVTISDDGNPTTGLAKGGHRTRFIVALQQGLAMAQHAHDKAAAAQITADLVDAAKLDAQEAAALAEALAAQVDAQIAAASQHAANAANQSSAAASSATAANGALLALGDVLANGIGMFSVNEDGELVGEYNTPTVTNLAINADGYMIVTY